MNDVVLGKADIIERALARATTTWERHADDLETDFDAQDVILVNLQRACEASIDLAMHAVRLRELGLPKDSRDAFTLLEQAGLLPGQLAGRMKKMVGFRNVAVHDYRAIDWAVVRSILKNDLVEVREYSAHMVRTFGAD
jgi:uncharacterized protein YutE (UPF0331/DUF86 family)